MTFLSSPAARALLIGTGTHLPGSTLPDVPQVADTVRDLAQVLTTRCGLQPNRLSVLVDPSGPEAIAEALREAAAEADDVLFVHYVGHGVLSAAGELHLATRATHDVTNGIATYQALPYRVVLDAVADCRVRSIVLVLDCCFSGRATPARVGDFFLLASATHDGVALAPVGARHTALSGEMIRLLEEGEPTGPAQLSMAYLHRHLDEVMVRRFGTSPRVQFTGRGGDLVLAANPAYLSAAHDPDGGGPGRPTRSPDSEAPYVGLRSYGRHNSELFFGRRELTEELVQRLRGRLWQPGPLTVIGPSGSGKSSLLRAGLLAAVGQGALGVPRSASWPALTLTPGAAPLQGLLSGLARLGRPDDAPSPEGVDRGQGPTRDQLLRTPELVVEAVHSAVARCHRRRTTSGEPGGEDRLVLVVDQFEELFTAEITERERSAFVAALCAASAPGEGRSAPPAIVVIGLRADFYGSCMRYPQLAASLTEDPLLVGAMTNQQLREVIEGPARAAGLAVEPEFAEVLMQDIGQWDTTDAPANTPPAVLPLLSHALLETWRRADGRRLTASAYVAAGRLGGAVVATADAVHGALDQAERVELRRLLPHLVTLGQGRIYLRRRTDLRHLTEAPSPDLAAGRPTAAVLDRLIGARLLTADQDTVEITHDVLFQAWPLLRECVESAREDILTRQRLVEAAQLWADGEPRDPSVLYQGVRLDAALSWAGQAGRESELEPLAREFLAASAEAAEQVRQAERRRTRRARQVAAALAALLLVATGAGTTAFGQWRAAARQTAIANQQSANAVSTAVAEQSDLELVSQQDESTLLAGAAWRIGQTEAARSSLLSAQSRPLVGTLTGGPRDFKSVLSVAISPNGQTVVGAGDGSRLMFWDGASRQLLTAIPLPGQGEVKALGFSPDGLTLVLSDGAGVQVWDAATRSLRVTLPANGVQTMAFNSTGTLLATGSPTNTQVWDIAKQQKKTTLDQGARFLQFAPDDSRLAIATNDGVLLVDPASGAADTVLAQGTKVYSVDYSPDGSQIALGLQQTVEILDGRTGEVLGSTPTGDVGLDGFEVAGYAFKSDLLLVADRGGIRVFDTADPKAPMRVADLATARPLTAFDITRDDSTLVTSAHGGIVELWRLPTLLSHSGEVSTASSGNVAYASDSTGDLVATMSPNGVINLVRPDKGQLIATLPAVNARTIQVTTTPGLSDGPQAVLSFNPAGTMLASYGEDGRTRLWQTATGKPAGELPAVSADSGPALASAFDPKDGRILAVAFRGPVTGTSSIVRLWDTSTGQPLSTFSTAGVVCALAFSPDGQSLATGESAGTVELWQVSGPRLARTLQASYNKAQGEEQIGALAFSPDGKQLAAGGTLATGPGGNPVMVWDLQDSHATGFTAGGHTSNISRLVFSPHGRLLAGIGLDGTVLLWDAKQHTAFATLSTRPYFQEMLAARFSPDEHSLTTVSTPTTAGGDLREQSWSLDPDTVLTNLCQTLRTNLTESEWKQANPAFPNVKTCPAYPVP